MTKRKANPKQRGRKPGYKPEFAAQAEKLCKLGATDREIADFFGVSERTIYRWQLDYPDFCQSLKVGKDVADERVERSLYRRATGYSFDSEKVFNDKGRIVRAATVEHVPPDTTAMIFWLKNRRAAQWREKSEVVHKHSLADLVEQSMQPTDTTDEVRPH